MLERIEEKIGTREFFGIIWFVLGIKATDNTPTILFTIGKNAGWMVPFFSLIATLIPLLATFKLLKKYDKGLIDILHDLLGKRMTYIIGIFMCILIIFNTGINSRSYVDIMQSLYLPRTPQRVVFLILLGSSCLTAWLGIEAIGRVTWITLPYIVAILIIASIVAWKELRLGYLFPILGAGTKPIIIGGITHSAYLNEVLALSIIYKNIKGYKEYKTASLMGLILAVLGLTWYMIMYITTFDYPAVVIVNFLFHTFTRFIHIGRFFSNIDAFYLIFWVIGSIIRFAVYLYVASAGLAFVFKLKEYRKLLLFLTVSAFIIGMLPENFFIETQWREVSMYFNLTAFSIIPIILFFISNLKEGKSS